MAVPEGILCNFDSNKLRLTSDAEAIGIVVEAFSPAASSASTLPRVSFLVGEGVEGIGVFWASLVILWLWLMWLATKTSSTAETLLALLPVPPFEGEEGVAAAVAEGAVVISEIVEATDVL